MDTNQEKEHIDEKVKPVSEPLSKCCKARIIQNDDIICSNCGRPCLFAEPEAAASVMEPETAIFNVSRLLPPSRRKQFIESTMKLIENQPLAEPARLFIWSCIMCLNRVQTRTSLHINERPICCQCNAEMAPYSNEYVCWCGLPKGNASHMFDAKLGRTPEKMCHPFEPVAEPARQPDDSHEVKG